MGSVKSCNLFQKRCNGNGFCNLTNGACTCDENFQGLDCSGNNESTSKIYILKCNFITFYF